MSTEITRSARIKGLINSDQTQQRLQSLLGDSKKRERFASTLINVSLDNSLINCSPESIVKSGLQAAELDLSLNKNMGLAYIVKYKKDAEFQVGYKGWQLLAKRCGIKLNVTPVFDVDEFEIISDGFDTSVKYKPNLDAQEDHKPEWVDSHLRGVLVSTKEDGEISHKFVNFGKILQIAGVSPSKGKGNFSPYSLWNLEMYMAKATKYVLSKMPMQEQLARAVEIENDNDKQKVEDVIIETKALNEEEKQRYDLLIQTKDIFISSGLNFTPIQADMGRNDCADFYDVCTNKALSEKYLSIMNAQIDALDTDNSDSGNNEVGE